MANVLIEENTMSAIGNAIREKTGKTDLILPKDMPTEIESIESGGSSSGQELLDAMIDGSITEIESNAESVKNYAFYYSNNLKSVSFPIATSIGKNAFNSCDTLTTVDFPLVTSIGEYAFNSCDALTTVDFPLVTSIGASAFRSCEQLETINSPLVTSIENYAFNGCEVLKAVDFPLLTSIKSSAFDSCDALTTVDFPLVTSIEKYAFNGCDKISAVILRNAEVLCTLSAANAFASTPIKTGTGYIYVPSALIEDYKVATNWSTYATQFRALEDYTVDGTVTGELDETKI